MTAEAWRSEDAGRGTEEHKQRVIRAWHGDLMAINNSPMVS